MDKVNRQVRAGIGLLAKTEAERMERYAKRNRPWKDRTGNAKNSIQGDFGWEGDVCKITLSGGMDYSVHLELAREKKYAILVPTTEKYAPQIAKGLKKVIGK